MKLITRTDELAAFCEPLAKAEFIAVDTEFMRERTYWPKLCLAQVAGPDEAAAIDALAEALALVQAEAAQTEKLASKESPEAERAKLQAERIRTLLDLARLGRGLLETLLATAKVDVGPLGRFLLSVRSSASS